MAEKVLNSRIVSTHDTEANWKSSTLVPKKGEIIIYDKDTSHDYSRIKIGDGTNTVSSLAFVGGSAAVVSATEPANPTEGMIWLKPQG